MKKIFFYLLITTGMVCLSLTTQAQQVTNNAKPPKASGPVLQSSADNKIPAASTVTEEKNLHQTAVKQSSFTGQLPVKANDVREPVKAPEQKPLPETNKIVPPGNSIKNR